MKLTRKIYNNIKGLGSIVDTHILKYLKIVGKTFDYIIIEKELRSQANALGVSIAVLDAMIWAAKVEEDQFVY